MLRMSMFFYSLTLSIILSLLSLHCLGKNGSQGLKSLCSDMPHSVDLPTAAKVDSRPWMALVWVSCQSSVSLEKNSTQSLLKTCEGALVGERWVLTSASCTQECYNVGLVSATVDIGLHSKDIREEIVAGRKIERISVDKVYSSRDNDPSFFDHPRKIFRQDFSVNASIYEDLMLLRLSRSVSDHSNVISLSNCAQKQPAFSSGDGLLNVEPSFSGDGEEKSVSTSDSKEVHGGRDCLVSSWGGPTSSGSVLQDMRLRLHTREECRLIMQDPLLSEGLLCVSGSRSNLTSLGAELSSMVGRFRPDCIVQEGTPLVVMEESSEGVSCEWKLLGLLSFGMGCHGNSDVTRSDQLQKSDNSTFHLTTPGLFVSVCPHLSWIRSTIEQDEALTAVTAACPVLPTPPPNGYICGRRETTPLSVEVCCERGYVLQGGSVYERDHGNGQWKPAIGPKCIPVTCPPLLPPLHGNTQPESCWNASYHEICWVSCDLGHTLDHGNGLITCTADGTWSTPPNCIPVDCGPPPTAGSLEVTYSSTLFNSMALYTCSHCHKLVGVAGERVEVVCGSDGKWKGPKPMCETVYCPPLTLPSFVTALFSSLQCGAQVHYSCPPGMILIGQQEAKCLSNGTWSALTPECTSVVCDAPTIAGSNFAQSNTSYPFGSVISVECDRCRVRVVEGVRGVDGTLTCVAEGKWDKPLPSCQWVTCLLPGFLANGSIQPLGQLYFCGTTVSFTCDQGYRLNGTEKNTSTCTQNGTWTEEFPTCEEIPVDYCPPPPMPGNHTHFCGSKVTQYLHSTVSYCCDGGYQFVGGVTVESVRCEMSGDWNRMVPECRPITCLSPSLSADVVITRVQLSYTQGQEHKYGDKTASEYHFGTRLTLDCVGIGQSVRGRSHLTCGEGGEWDHPPPTCVEADGCSVACGVPHPPRYGRIISIIRPGVGIIPHLSRLGENGVMVGDVAVFVCNHGYYLHGSGSRRCGSNGVWSGQEPQCLTSDQPRSQFIFRNPTNTSKWETTDSAYFLSTNTIYLACQISSVGMGRALPIRKIDGPLLNPRNTRTRAYGNPSRSTQLAIQPRNTVGGHSMQGVYLCQVQSTTNSSLIVSKALTIHIHNVLCPSPRLPPRGRLVTMGTIPGSCLHYECSRGYTLIGSNDRVCLTDGSWTGDTPVCLSTYNATCSSPPPVDHGSLTTPIPSGTYHINDTVTYECDTGYILLGGASRQCVGGNRWSGDSPLCELERGQDGG